MKIPAALLLAATLCFTGCAKNETASLSDTLRAEADSGSGLSEDESFVPTVTASPAPSKTTHIGPKKSGGSGTAYSLGRTLIAEAEGFSFWAEGIATDLNGNHILSVSWQNSTDKSYLILPESVCVNGYCFDPKWVGTAEPGSSDKGEILFSAEEMTLRGLGFCDEITFTLSVSAEDALFVEYLIQEMPITLRPTGVTEESVEVPGVIHREGETLLMHEDGLTCLLLGPETEYDTAEYACVLMLWLENGTDTELTFGLDGVEINGEAVDPYWAVTVPARARAYSRVYFGKEDMEAIGVSSIEAVDALTGTLTVYKTDTYDTLTEAEVEYRPAGTAESD